MYQLTICGPDGSEVSYWLGPDQGLVVGTDDTCDVVLASRRVSGRHARFFTLGDRLHVEDLDSQSGVFIGGARVTGVTEFRAGPPIEIGEFKLRFAKAEGRAAATGPAVASPRLRGSGAMQGRELVLPARAVFGRDRSADVPLGDDSVSRRHAEVRREGERVFVKDLGSSNGTFVNGRRLPANQERELRNLDKVRFGDTQWVLEGGAQAPPQAESSRKPVVAAVVAVLVVVLVAAVAGLRPTDGPVVDEGEATALEQAEEQIALGLQAFEDDRFEEARRHFEKAQYIDPVHLEARMSARRAARELEFARIFKEATGKSELGRDDEALALFVRIGTDSRYFARARLKVQELATVMMRRDGQACREAARKRRWADALEPCARYLDLRCHKEMDEDALQTLRTAEAQAGRKGEWSCPAHLASWFGVGGSSSSEAIKEVGAKYADAALREAMLAYLKGELDAAQKRLAKVKKGGPQVEAVVESLAIIDARYREGQAAFLRGSIGEAERAYRIALDRDRTLMPASAESFHAGQMRNMLAQGFYKEGSVHFEKGREVEAFEQWSRGLAYQPKDGPLLDGIARLERSAANLLGGRPSCEDISRALRITLSEPPSAAHRRARDQFDRDCS